MSEKPWADRLRTRVGLRAHLRREPTEEEIENAYINQKHSKTDKIAIKRDFDNGKEVCLNFWLNEMHQNEIVLQLIHVWIMRCIGYDEAFQRKIASMPSGWGT